MSMRRYPLLLSLIMLASAWSAHGQQTFHNVAPQLGITGMTGLGHSVGWGDIDNDGDPDLALGNQGGSGYWLFRNDGDVFTNITSSAGLNGMNANKTILAEFTGDRHNDLLIRNFGAWEYSSLFENEADGTFSNITNQAMLPDSGAYNVAD